MSALARLTDVKALEAHWDETPFVARDLGDMSDVFSVPHVERLLKESALTVGTVRLFEAGGVVDDTRYSLQRELGASRERLIDSERVWQLISSGATVVLEELQTYCAPVKELAHEFMELTGFSTYCAGFLTPSSRAGLPAHYDAISVLLRQVSGFKHWRISAPDERWPAQKWQAGQAPRGEPVLDVTLEPGECLYIPRGYFHVGEATSAASLHLSVGIKPITWDHMLRALMDSTGDDVFRESVPFAFHRQSEGLLADSLRGRVDTLASRLADGSGGELAGRATRRGESGPRGTAANSGRWRTRCSTER